MTIVFHKNGYQDTTATLEVPGPGRETKLIQPLPVSTDLARIKLTSEPTGAQVVQNGLLLAGVTTPAEVLVEAGKPVKFTLTMRGKVPAVVESFTPGRGADLVKSAKLIDGAMLSVASNLEGKVSVAKAPHCQSLDMPIECVLAPGTYYVEITLAPQGAVGGRAVRKITMGAKSRAETIDFGYVEAAPNKLLQIGGGAGARRAVFEVGAHKVTVTGGEEGNHTVTVNVKAGATVIAN